MDKHLLRQFASTLHTLPDKEYLAAKIAFEAAPTLFGIKPASLISFCKNCRNSRLIWDVCKDDVCSELNLHYFELKKTPSHTLVLFFQTTTLLNFIKKPKNVAFLTKMGYEETMTLDEILHLLQRKLRYLFPHEIGLLLGIPQRDIMAFMQKQGGDCIFCGYWKVYHNPIRAAILFAYYDRARNSVMRTVCHGQTLRRFNETVSARRERGAVDRSHISLLNIQRQYSV